MEKKLKNKWVKVLRSGKYTQGKGFLYNKKSNTFCCLGVLGAVCGVPLEKLNRKTFLLNFKGDAKVPKDLTGCRGITSQLANMNDKGDSFDIIADFIEKDL